MGLTIRDVARAAGFSTATVSRALRGLDNVDPATRDRILTVAREMNFSVSPAASRLASGRAGSIGIVTPFVGGWYFTEVFAGIEEELQSFDVDLQLHSTGMVDGAGEPLRALQRMRRRVDGVLVIGLPPTIIELEGLFDLGVPVVLLGVSSPEVPSVYIDDKLGARKAVQHLVDRGHERIALVSGRPGASMFVPEHDRMKGYLEILAENGLPADQSLREAGDFTAYGGQRAMSVLLSRHPAPTAVFCMSDEMAYGAIRAMSRLGLSAGRDIAVIGFDGHDLADIFDLSTVAQPVRSLGRIAVQRLMARVAGSADADATVLPTQLQARGSTTLWTPRPRHADVGLR